MLLRGEIVAVGLMNMFCGLCFFVCDGTERKVLRWLRS